MKYLFAGLLALAALFHWTAPAQAQPCQWNYSMQPGTPDPNQGIATATYCGNVVVDGTITGLPNNTYPSMSSMSALTAAQMAFAGTTNLQGYYNGSPFGSGSYRWLTAIQSTGLSPDGGVIIAPSDHPGTCSFGCLYLQNNGQAVSALSYGILANGIDVTSSMQSFFNAGVALSNNVGTPTPLELSSWGSTAAYKITSGLAIDAARVMLDGKGANLDCETASISITCLTINWSNNNDNLSPLYANSREIKNLYVQGASKITHSSSVGVNCSTTAHYNDYLKIYGLSIHGNATGLVLGDGCWGTQFIGLAISGDTSNPIPDTGITFTTGYEGEPVYINGGFIGAVTAINAPYTNSWIDMNLVHIDGIKTILRQGGDSKINLSNMYTELTNGDDTQPLFVQSNNCTPGSCATLTLNNYHFVVRDDLVTRTNTPYFDITGTVYLNNVVFQNSIGNAYKANGGFLATGTGHILRSPNSIQYINYPWAPLPDVYSTWNAYPTISSATNSLDGFVTSNSGAFSPTYNASVTHGTARPAIRFQINNTAPSGSFSRLTWTQAVSPDTAGRRVSFVGSYGSSGLVGSNVIYETVFTYSNGTSTLGTSTVIVSSLDAATWTTVGTDGGFVPVGTTQIIVQIQIRAINTVAGNVIIDMNPMGLGFSQ